MIHAHMGKNKAHSSNDRPSGDVPSPPTDDPRQHIEAVLQQYDSERGQIALSHLAIDSHQIAWIAGRLANLKNLHTLDIGANSIDDAGARAIAENLKDLHRLNIWHNAIGEAGARAIAENLKDLHTLNIWRNAIGEAGAKAIAENLKDLHTLNIGYNAIGEAGARAIAENLKGLHTLDIEANDIGEAGARAIAENLKDLHTLNIGANSIGATGAKAIAKNLKGLHTLNIGTNSIGEAGARAIAENLKALHTLDIGGNAVGKAGVLALEALLPPQGQLRALLVRDLPQLQLPDEVVNSCDARWILTELRRPGRAIRQVKILVLGDGEMGKTQLVNRLRNLPFEEDAARTPDIETHTLEFAKVGRDNEALTARIYDFGGQPHLWSAHRFFLANRHNLYIVVIDGTRQSRQRLDYWLHYLRHYVGREPPAADRTERQDTGRAEQEKIPVLVVFTNSDRTEASKTQNRRPFATISKEEADEFIGDCADFADVRVVRQYSSRTDEGLPDVQKRLRNLMRGMSYVFNTRYADSLHRVKDYLEGNAEARAELGAEPFKQSLSIDALNALFRKAQRQIDGSVDDGDFLIWRQILRNLGVVHWVGDVPGVASGVPIANTVYSPEWVRKLVYAIIRAETPFRGNGVADEQTLCRLMSAVCDTHEPGRDEVQPCHRQMLELMQACHLIFPAKNMADPQWLILDWLAPITGFVFEHAPAFVLEFDDHLPESLLLRFAGEWFSQIAGNEVFNCLSREHVVVAQYGDGTAQVAIKADWRTRRVVAWSLGGTQRHRDELVAQVKGELLKQARSEGLLPRIALREADAGVDALLNNDAKDQKLAGLVMVTVAEANQICRLLTMYDKGIDGEIEFRKDDCKPSGCKVYLQLKSGDSYLRRRGTEGQLIFDVKNQDHLEYWVSHDSDVHLVIANSNWLVRWMNVTRYLNARRDKTSRQIVFDGEVLDKQAILGLRELCMAERKSRQTRPK
jgi:GTPase SAR1 family protein/Ran GTPase-activating protein (RanGAP) involved in mRNA processing and transport